MSTFTPFCYRALPFRVNWESRNLAHDQPDGDSIWLLMDKGDYQYSNANCRLFGINAPEMNDKNENTRKKAANARDFLTGLLKGPVPCPHDWVEAVDKTAKFCRICCDVVKSVIKGPANLYIRSEKLDKYGRPLVTIWTDPSGFGDFKKSVNQAMLDAGHAVPYAG